MIIATPYLNSYSMNYIAMVQGLGEI